MSELAATRLAAREEQVIRNLIEQGYYLNVSEFLREAVREKLEKLGETKLVIARKMSREKAKTEILAYLEKRPAAYVSEVADELGLDLDLAFQVVGELIEERKVGEANGTL